CPPRFFSSTQRFYLTPSGCLLYSFSTVGPTTASSTSSRGFFLTHFVKNVTKLAARVARAGIRPRHVLPDFPVPAGHCRLRRHDPDRRPRHWPAPAHAGQDDAVRVRHGSDRRRPPAL